jgi:hypothetical protein
MMIETVNDTSTEHKMIAASFYRAIDNAMPFGVASIEYASAFVPYSTRT